MSASSTPEATKVSWMSHHPAQAQLVDRDRWVAEQEEGAQQRDGADGDDGGDDFELEAGEVDGAEPLRPVLLRVDVQLRHEALVTGQHHDHEQIADQGEIDERQGEHGSLLPGERPEVAELGNQLAREDHHDRDQREHHPGVERRQQPAGTEQKSLEADFQPSHRHIMRTSPHGGRIVALSPLAGKPAPKELLIDLARLEREYYRPQARSGRSDQLVSFGTSGHRGTLADGTFTEAHILAITQAICDYRRGQDIDGPLFMGKDTHALSGPAQRTALEVLAANGVETIIQPDDGVTPTPSSRAPSSSTTAAAKTASPTASSSRRRTIRRKTAASNTIRPTAARPTPTSPAGSQDRANELLREEQCRREAHAVRRPRSRPRPRTRRISSCPMSTICATSSTWTPFARPA